MLAQTMRARCGILVLITTGLVGAVWAGSDDLTWNDGAYLPDRTPEYRAFWADAFSQGFKSTTQINSLISRALAGNYNVIIAEVLAYHDNGSSGHGAYWNSSIVPKATDISGGIDPLAVLVTQAHANGIEVQAWIVPYRASTSWPPNNNTQLTAHPEWLMVEQADMDGGPATIGGKYTLDPGSPDVQEYLVSIVRELVQNYAIDGINLDYIRYTQEDAGYPADAGYAKSSLARFQDLTGYVGTPAPTGVTSWNNFRRQTIDEFVRRLRAEIPSITSNPSQPLALTADLICWGGAPANFSNSDAYRLHQNWRLWMERGWLDIAVPMNYKREFDTTEAAWYRQWVDAAIGWSYSRHVICGQGNYLNRKIDSVTQLQYCYSAGADGTCNYSYDATADENINGTPETDWTWYTYVSTFIFTTATTVPVMPWRDPATATEGTLWGQVIDDNTGLPVDGADVQVGGLATVQTDGNGIYVVTLIPAASGGTSYTVTAESTACSQKTYPGITVWPGELAQLDIVLCDVWAGPGDFDVDGDIDGTDFGYFIFCMQGPDDTFVEGHVCLNGDADENDDISMPDFVNFQAVFDGGL